MQLQFLYGKNLKDKTVETSPGRIYLDIATGELFFDDPTAINREHSKIVDTATLIYTVTESVTFPSSGDEDDDIPGGGNASSGTSAVLGVAVLGSMMLGTS